jgi:hypothetical protein
MKHTNAILTVIAILLSLLVLKVYVFPDSIFEKIGEKQADETYLDKRSGRLYIYSPKYLGYPATMKVVDLKSHKEKNYFIKD